MLRRTDSFGLLLVWAEQSAQAHARPQVAERRFPIPEPASLVLLTTGLIGLAARRHLLRRTLP